MVGSVYSGVGSVPTSDLVGGCFPMSCVSSFSGIVIAKRTLAPRSFHGLTFDQFPG